MVKIRLRRTGAKKQPYYRIVVQESRSPRDGKFIEMIGNYNPRSEPPTIEIDAERAVYWLGVGAQPSEAVRRMFDKLGILSQAAAARQVQPGGPLPAAAAFGPAVRPLDLEELAPAEAEEDEDLELDMFEGEESEESEGEWESDADTSDELDDMDEDDWEAEVDDADDDDEDQEMDDDE